MQGIIRKIYILSALTILFPHAAMAVQVVGLAIEQHGQGERIIINISDPVRYTVFDLTKPDRLVVDFPSLRYALKDGLPANYRDGVIRNIRYAQFNQKVSRIVFDLSGPVKVAQHVLVQPGDGVRSYRLVLDLVVGVSSQATENSAAATAYPVPELKPRGVAAELVKPMIVIDAGHGGNDPGAIGASGNYEKHITFDYARTLEKALLATGRYRVTLTRSDDRFILLRERVAIARRAKGDLFISLHADSAPGNQAQGLSVYTLSEVASDKEAEALAARENKVDILYGMDLSHENKDVADILIDLAQRETKNKSAEFADMLMQVMKRESVRLLPNPHRFAGFAVLKGPDIPAVLVELGFITNPREEKNLKDSKYRAAMVQAMVKGIDSYFNTHRK